MAESAAAAGAQHNRRHRRTQRKKARIRRVLAIVAGTAVGLSFLLVATDLVRIGSGDTPSLADTLHNSPAAGVVPSATTTTTARHKCRTFSASDPLELWVGGDSLAGSLGPALGTITGATGVVQPYFDSRVSSGLADPGFFDWPDHATTELARISPDIVVFIIGANDWTAVSGDTWKADYARRVEEMVTILTASGRTAYWVGAPILKDEKMNAAVAQINAVAAEVVKRHSDAHFVDAYKLFSDPDGHFALNLPDETGKLVTMRAGDGVHLTTNGGDYLARAVFKLVDAQCGITAQKVDGAAKQTIESEGSTQVAPGSSTGSSTGSTGSSSSSGSSSGGSVQTTPPATTFPRFQTQSTYVPPTTRPGSIGIPSVPSVPTNG
jgi:hypothetical protein